jgi:hypothetical protein
MSEGNFKEKEKLVKGPRWAVGSKLTSTSIIVHFDLVQHFIEDTVLQLTTGN